MAPRKKKTGAPRGRVVTESGPRDYTFGLRLTAEERALVEAHARAAGTPPSIWARAALLTAIRKLGPLAAALLAFTACDAPAEPDLATVHLIDDGEPVACEGHRVEAWTFDLIGPHAVTALAESIVLDCGEDLVLQVDRSLPLLNVRVDGVPACPDVIPSVIEEVWVQLGGCPIPFPGAP